MPCIINTNAATIPCDLSDPLAAAEWTDDDSDETVTSELVFLYFASVNPASIPSSYPCQLFSHA